MGFVVAIFLFLIGTAASYADAREDFAKCVDAYVVRSIKSKPSLVDFTVTLDKVCASEATALISGHDSDFPSTGNAAMDALAEDTKSKLRGLSDRYVKDSKGAAVAHYSKLQEIWRRTGIETR